MNLSNSKDPCVDKGSFLQMSHKTFLSIKDMADGSITKS